MKFGKVILVEAGLGWVPMSKKIKASYEDMIIECQGVPMNENLC